ncbi:SLC13 family permease [Persicimonas caeni]|uniref:SLC13 family permease n=2 Tax=Persicimonas caeni TaxID=2292766 RepID=A0A4Y6Q383_PERCE|nr:SLC13 family permease [Persicimonas caeni]QED36131.1 SLC13 family permease [Persicimonas caeni]
MIMVLAILAGAVTLFVTEVVRIDVAAIIIMVVIGLSGLVGADDLFAGFASNAVISIIAVMILGAGLDRVGVMRRVAAFLLRIGGKTEGRISSLISTAVATISAFMQNIGAAALFLPVAERLSERTKIPVSRLLMPMGFAAILGGTMTLVASGPLILLNDLLASTASNLNVEIEPYGLFAPTPIGVTLVISGILLFAFAGKWLLPNKAADRDAHADLPGIAAIYGLDQDIRAYLVPEGSDLLHRRVADIEAEHEGILVVAVHDGDGLTIAPYRDYIIEPGMVVGLVGDGRAVEAFAAEQGLNPVESDPFTILHDKEHAGLAEVIIRPGGDAVGNTVRELRLRELYDVTLLAVHRNGKVITDDLRQVKLEAGDVLVLFTPWGHLDNLAKQPAFVILSDYPTEPPRTNKMWWALGAFALSLSLVIFTSLQLSLALMVGAGIVLVSGVLTADEAYRAVSWKTIFLLAALIPLGQAVEDTGTAAWIAENVINAAGGLPPWGMQLVIALVTTVFTLTISNVGATVLLVPLAANVAVGVGADPAQFGLIVALAASNAFLLPTHQVNALLMGPGGYRVKDFMRAGTAMTVLFLVVLIVTVNIFV